MAEIRLAILTACALVSVYGQGSDISRAPIYELTENNWKQTLEGEWFVKFYAPWCPACRAITSDWEKLAEYLEALGVKVGDVDVTQEALLNGKFMVTMLPTIFHFKDGQIRQYSGQRSFETLMRFIEEKEWESVDALPYYRHPSSIPMAALSYLYKFSMVIKNFTEYLDDQGYASHTVYLITAAITVFIGIVLGLLMVAITDYFWPAVPQQPQSRDNKNSRRTESKQSDDLPLGATASSQEQPRDKKND